MLTAFDWNAKAHPNTAWKLVLETVAAEARAHLSTLLPNKTIATRELVEALYPIDSVRGDGEKVRQRIFRALLSKHFLDDCRTKSPTAKVFMGRARHPWLWHAPEKKTCPHCGGDL